jgi:hypothetical protein
MIPSKNNYATPSPKESIATIQQDLTRKILELRVRLKALVKSLPEASSDLRRLPGTANCGVVSSSILSSSNKLSPSYYLTGDAIAHLERLIDTTDILTLDKKIQEILNTGKIYTGASRYPQSLSHEFIEALRHAWEGDSNVTSIPQ